MHAYSKLHYFALHITWHCATVLPVVTLRDTEVQYHSTGNYSSLRDVTLHCMTLQSVHNMHTKQIQHIQHAQLVNHFNIHTKQYKTKYTITKHTIPWHDRTLHVIHAIQEYKHDIDPYITWLCITLNYVTIHYVTLRYVTYPTNFLLMIWALPKPRQLTAFMEARTRTSKLMQHTCMNQLRSEDLGLTAQLWVRIFLFPDRLSEHMSNSSTLL